MEIISENDASSVGEVSRLTEHLFRQESAKLVAVLTRVFGIDRLHFAEDVVQDTLIKALKTWPYAGIPEKPAAWLMQTAKNRALDLVRREARFREKQEIIAATLEQWPTESTHGAPVRFETEISADRLRLMFACCHPLIPQESQSALALKTLCGFSPGEIARAFLTTEVAVNKRLTRARRSLRDGGIPFEIPAGAALEERLEAVLRTLYLLFNEGHKASGGDKLIRAELCAEAVRLTASLVEHPCGDLPDAHALMALMLLNSARLDARQDAAGRILLLQAQDRSRWDATMIARGLSHLARSASGNRLSVYHLQAGIAACHCTAPDYASTDWPRILALYDSLVTLEDSPVVALNRAVAVAQVHGPAAGIGALEAIAHINRLQAYYLFHVVRAEFEADLGNPTAAAAHLRKALPLVPLEVERSLLLERLKNLRVDCPFAFNL